MERYLNRMGRSRLVRLLSGLGLTAAGFVAGLLYALANQPSPRAGWSHFTGSVIKLTRTPAKAYPGDVMDVIRWVVGGKAYSASAPIPAGWSLHHSVDIWINYAHGVYLIGAPAAPGLSLRPAYIGLLVGLVIALFLIQAARHTLAPVRPATGDPLMLALPPAPGVWPHTPQELADLCRANAEAVIPIDRRRAQTATAGFWQFIQRHFPYQDSVSLMELAPFVGSDQHRDTVAGPLIQALKDRGVIDARYPLDGLATS